MTRSELKELERLRKENAILKGVAKAKLFCKVSTKGGVSVYGLQRFPVTLYREQWEMLLPFSNEIFNFILEHADQLKTKGE